jgi:insulysin
MNRLGYRNACCCYVLFIGCHPLLAFRPMRSAVGASQLPIKDSSRCDVAYADRVTRLHESPEAGVETFLGSIDLDKVRRRQLVFGLLTAASTTAFAGVAVAETIASLSTAAPAITFSTEDFLGIVKPPLDDREYVAYTLENGLRVLLCSDDASNEAAVAMDVHVGACSDPAHVPGLAHFNEHMLFLGTKKYPSEDSFEAFLATNGGSSNAYTASEDTVYYFDLEAEADQKLAEGLSRFGAFFTAPLFTEGATGRELNAIESENAKNLQSDSFRLLQVDKSRANPGHPYSKFFTGNRKTLLDNTKALGIDLREELVKFYERYYSANQMTLAVVAPQSIEVLKNMVASGFSDIPNRQVGKPEEEWAGVPSFNDDSLIPSFNNVVEIVPVQDLRQVMISWPIVYQSEQDKEEDQLNKPTTYVSHLIGHEGPRSLLSYLKSRGWANSLFCANTEELSDFEVFQVVVGLTIEGLAHVDDVIGSVYSYINMLRSRKVPNYVFEEVLQLEELQWRFLTNGSPRNYATSLSTAMQRYPPPLYVAGPRRLALTEFLMDGAMSDAARSSFASRESLEQTRRQMEHLVDNLSVDKALVTVLSKTFENETDKMEKWYGTAYRVRPIPAAMLEKWRFAVRAEGIKVDFPRPNQFIPTEYGLRVLRVPAETSKAAKRTFESRMLQVPPPKILRDDGPDGSWRVYFKQDDRFGLPKGYIVFQVVTSEAFSSPKRAALANLFEICIADRLGEYAYDGKFSLAYGVPLCCPPLSSLSFCSNPRWTDVRRQDHA